MLGLDALLGNHADPVGADAVAHRVQDEEEARESGGAHRRVHDLEENVETAEPA